MNEWFVYLRLVNMTKHVVEFDQNRQTSFVWTWPKTDNEERSLGEHYRKQLSLTENWKY